MNNEQIPDLYQRVLIVMENKLNHYKMLYSLTKHSKKKAKHKENIKFQEEIIEDAKLDYGLNQLDDIHLAEEYGQAVLHAENNQNESFEVRSAVELFKKID